MNDVTPTKRDEMPELLPPEIVEIMKRKNAEESVLVRKIGDAIGYGRLMQLAEEIWSQKAKEQHIDGSEHTVGPCAGNMVPCSHAVKDDNGHCEICCGSGRITKWVNNNLPAPADGELREALELIEAKANTELCCHSGGETARYNALKDCRNVATKALEKHAAAIQKSQDSK